jgi:hypothetical protein
MIAVVERNILVEANFLRCRLIWSIPLPPHHKLHFISLFSLCVEGINKSNLFIRADGKGPDQRGLN